MNVGPLNDCRMKYDRARGFVDSMARERAIIIIFSRKLQRIPSFIVIHKLHRDFLNAEVPTVSSWQISSLHSLHFGLKLRNAKFQYDPKIFAGPFW